MLTCSSRQSLAVSAQAVGLASEACTLAWRRYCVCLSTTHCGSPNPRGLLSSAFTHGLGTWKPRLPTTFANRLVPLRPEPATSSRCLLMRCSLPVLHRLRSRTSIAGVEECGCAVLLDRWPSFYPDKTTEHRVAASITAHQGHVGTAEVFDDVQPLRALYSHDPLWQRSSFPEGMEQIPLPPLALVDLELEVRMGPVPELVGVQPLQLEAYPVGPLDGEFRIGPDVLPIEALDERVLGGVAPAPRLEGRLPEVDVGYAL